MAWKKGQSGNPNGRPRGSKQKLSERFLHNLYKDWKAHGTEALDAMREASPLEYVKLVASLLPKQDYVSAKVDHQQTHADESTSIAWIREVLREEKIEPPEGAGTKSVPGSEDAPVY